MRLPFPLARSRPRLITALLIGLAIIFILPDSWTWITRMLIGWNVAVWSYMILVGWLMTHATPARVRTIAEREDNSAIAVLVIMSVAAALSIAAIVLELAAVKHVEGALKLAHYLFTILTVLGSWLLVAVIYTFHYAHLFYRAPAQYRPLRFPDNEAQPDYWDFLYFAFTIAVAAQTSDVSVLSRSMRKAVMAQSLLSFLFNVAILGMSVNIAAGMLGM